jgi:hypothetical protein
MTTISKRAKVTSDKPAYESKEKTDSGFVWKYDPAHIIKRWDEKKKKLNYLEKNIEKLRKQYEKDLSSDDLRTRAESSIVGIIDDTAARIGNEDSVKEYDTYGVTTLKVKHLTIKGSKAIFKFIGKDQVKQDISTSNSKIIKVLKELIKGKKDNDFIFEIDGTKIWDRAVNRYLAKFDISAKDLRGFQANRLMKDVLKKKDWKEALDEVADIVGHKPATLKNQYLDPDLVAKYENKKKASISIRSDILPLNTSYDPGHVPQGYEDAEAAQSIGEQNINVDINKNVTNIKQNADQQVYPNLMIAWRILAPFLPQGSTLTSTYRTDFDQAKIILDFWGSWKWDGTPNEKNHGFFHTNFGTELGITDQELIAFDSRVAKKILTRKEIAKINTLQVKMSTYVPQGIPGEPTTKVAVAPIGESGHKYGIAFDVWGASGYQIKNAIKFINKNLGNIIQLASEPRIEIANNAIHVELSSSIRMPSTEDFKRTLSDFYLANPRAEKQIAKDQEIVKKNNMHLSIRAKLLPEDELWLHDIESKIPGIAKPKTQILNKDLITIPSESNSSLNINPGVKLNTLIYDAWRMLQPFLPRSARMTSGFRTPDDQKRILEMWWSRAGFTRNDPGFGDYMYAMPAKLRERNYIVGPIVTNAPYAHLKGSSLDISGANLYDIVDAVKEASNSGLPITLVPLVEEMNNCVHVNIHNAKYDAVALQSVLKNKGIRTASLSIRAVPLDPQSWKSDPNPHRLSRHQDYIMNPFGGNKIPQKQDMGALKEMYSGVHTTDDKKLAMIYANDRANQSDPPVVLEIETGGLKPHADVDAVAFMPVITTMYNDAVQHFDDMLKSKIEMYSDLQKSSAPGNFLDSFVNEIRKELENNTGNFDNETPSDVSGIISEQAKRADLNALSDFYPDDKKFMKALQDILKNGKVEQGFAAYVTNQYRYLEEIPDVRIMAAYTFKPFDSGDIRSDYEEESDKEQNESDPVKITYEDIDYGWLMNSVGFKEMWRNPHPIHLKNSRIQYHGTTMSRAKQILSEVPNFNKKASELDEKIPNEIPAVEDPKNPHGVGTEMGFGIDDLPGDWFEKSPMFVERTDIPEYEIHDISEQEAKNMIKEEPTKFFYRGLHKTFPMLELEAMRNLIETNAKFFFVFRYHDREEAGFKDMIERAAELLSQQDVRAFFYYHLHHTFPELGRGAIIQLIDTNPDSFFDFGLQKDYPDFEESANAARNIKDPNKVELEQPEWVKNDPGQSISIREKNAMERPFDDNIIKYDGIPHDAVEILRTLPGTINITDTTVIGEIQVSKDPEVVIEWHLIDNSKYATRSAEKYLASIVVAKRYKPGYSERSTIYNCSDSDALIIARDIKSELEDPDFINELIDNVVSIVEEKKQEQDAFKRLNNLNLEKKLSKRASDYVPQITLTAEEKQIFDLLNDVKDYYKLPIELRAVGGYVRDKLIESGIVNNKK